MPGIAEAIRTATTIPGWSPRPLLEALATVAAAAVRPGGAIVEVGAWQGRTSVVLAAVAAEVGATLHAIDAFGLPAHPDGFSRYLYAEGAAAEAAWRRHLAPFPRARLTVADSRTALATLPPASADLVWIDGDHEDPVVSADLDRAWPLVRPGGVLCGDDYSEGDVGRAVDARFPARRLVLWARLWAVDKAAA